jgi:hypothetical protein
VGLFSRLLGERRAGYSTSSRRTSRRSDVGQTGQPEIYLPSFNDTFTGIITFIAAVVNGRIAGITTIVDDERTGKRKATEEWDNPTSELSPQSLIYGFPRDWQPSSLRFAVAFRDQPLPSRVWAVVAPTLFDLACATERHELPFQEHMVMARIDKPRRDRLYGVFWTF